MNKELTPLKALERIKDTIRHLNYGFIDKEDSEDFNIIETALKDYEKKTKLAKEYANVNNVAKRLKTLEIIKEKKVDVDFWFSTPDYEYYSNYCNGGQELTPSEYELLKEVLL